MFNNTISRRITDITAMSRLFGPMDEHRTYFNVYGSSMQVMAHCLADSGSTSSLFIRSEFVKKMNADNRTAWLWSYDSQKMSEHKLVTYAATGGQKAPKIIGQWGGYITVEVRQPGATEGTFVEILATAFIIAGTSPGADLLAGCRWLGCKGLIPLSTAKSNNLTNEVLLQFDALVDDTQPQVVLDFFCNPSTAPVNFKINEMYRSRLASAVARQQSTSVSPSAASITDGAAAMELEQQQEHDHAEPNHHPLGYDDELVNTVSHLIRGLNGNLTAVAKALAASSRVQEAEAHRRVTWACANGATLFDGSN